MEATAEPRMVTDEEDNRFWLWPDGVRLPVISGGADDDDGDDDDEGDDDDDDENDDPKAKKGKGSQAHMNAISAQAKREGKRVARKELLKQLGVDDPEEAAALIKAAKEKSETDKTDLEKAQKAAADAEAKATKAEAELRKRDRERLIERRVLAADVPAKMVEKVTRLLDLPDDDGDDLEAEIVDAAIKDLKKDVPALFSAASNGEEEEDGDGQGELDPRTGLPPVAHKPPAPPKPSGKPKSTEDQAKSLVAQRHPELVKKS